MEEKLKTGHASAKLRTWDRSSSPVIWLYGFMLSLGKPSLNDQYGTVILRKFYANVYPPNCPVMENKQDCINCRLSRNAYIFVNQSIAIK